MPGLLKATFDALNSDVKWTFSTKKTRSSSACHVGPLALERVIIFAQLLCYETHLNFF